MYNSPCDTTPIEPYVVLTERIRVILSSPKAQIEQHACIAREPGESALNWERLLDELRDAEGITLTYRDDGVIQVAWYVIHSMS